jgi:hypothetical protein
MKMEGKYMKNRIMVIGGKENIMKMVMKYIMKILMVIHLITDKI